MKGHNLNPKNVINEMKLIKSNFIALFMKDCIEITNNKKDRMRSFELYNIFKIYYMTNYKKNVHQNRYSKKLYIIKALHR